MKNKIIAIMTIMVLFMIGQGYSATIDVYDADFTFYTDMGSTYFTTTTPPIVTNPTLANLNATITLFCWSNGMETTIAEDEFVATWTDLDHTFDSFTRYVETSCDGDVYGSVFFDDGVSVAELGLNGLAVAPPIVEEDNTTARQPILETTSQLPQVGEDVGGFLDNLFPVAIALVLGLAIIGGIVGIFNSVTGVISRAVKGGKK